MIRLAWPLIHNFMTPRSRTAILMTEIDFQPKDNDQSIQLFVGYTLFWIFEGELAKVFIIIFRNVGSSRLGCLTRSNLSKSQNIWTPSCYTVLKSGTSNEGLFPTLQINPRAVSVGLTALLCREMNWDESYNDAILAEFASKLRQQAFVHVDLDSPGFYTRTGQDL